MLSSSQKRVVQFNSPRTKTCSTLELEKNMYVAGFYLFPTFTKCSQIKDWLFTYLFRVAMKSKCIFNVFNYTSLPRGVNVPLSVKSIKTQLGDFTTGQLLS